MTSHTYQQLIQRLADTGQPLQLNGQDLATVLTHDAAVLVDVVLDNTVIQSMIGTLKQHGELSIETALFLGGAIAGALKAKAEGYVRRDVTRTLQSRRFGGGDLSIVSQEVH